MPLLAIETTCDETAAAVVDRSRTVRSSVVASQDELHARWRGVVPEVASRAHVERIIPVIDEAVFRAGVSRGELEAVAVAVTPGLVGSLLVGLSAAKAVALALEIPIVGYDHIAAHLYACRLAHGDRLRYPCVGLVASGGHTSLFHVHSPLEMDRLGGTIDDAAGEAFDKAASLLGLGYPGGPQIERAAVGADDLEDDRIGQASSGCRVAGGINLRTRCRVTTCNERREDRDCHRCCAATNVCRIGLSKYELHESVGLRGGVTDTPITSECPKQIGNRGDSDRE